MFSLKLAQAMVFVLICTAMTASALTMPKNRGQLVVLYCQNSTIYFNGKLVDYGGLARNQDPKQEGLWDSSQQQAYKVFWKPGLPEIAISIDKSAPTWANVILIRTNAGSYRVSLNRGDRCVIPNIIGTRLQVVSYVALSHY